MGGFWESAAQFGWPLAVLIFGGSAMGLALWKILQWLAANVVKPEVDERLKLMIMLRETGRENSATLAKLAEAQHSLVEGQKELTTLHHAIVEQLAAIRTQTKTNGDRLAAHHDAEEGWVEEIKGAIRDVRPS